MLDICYQHVLTAPHLASNGASPPCNPLTNVHAANNAIHKPASSHALAAKFKPCRTNAPQDRYVNTNLNSGAHPPPHKTTATA